jgi:hypothetical protein
MCGLRGEKVPIYEVFNVLIYMWTYLKYFTSLIYIQGDKTV